MKKLEQQLDEEVKQFSALKTSKYKGMPGIIDDPNVPVTFLFTIM